MILFLVIVVQFLTMNNMIYGLLYALYNNENIVFSTINVLN